MEKRKGLAVRLADEEKKNGELQDTLKRLHDERERNLKEAEQKRNEQRVRFIEKPTVNLMDESQVGMVVSDSKRFACLMELESVRKSVLFRKHVSRDVVNEADGLLVSPVKQIKITNEWQCAVFPLEYVSDFLKFFKKMGCVHARFLVKEDAPMMIEGLLDEGGKTRRVRFFLAPRIESDNERSDGRYSRDLNDSVEEQSSER